MFDIILFGGRLKCSYEEKLDAFKTARKMYELSLLARREGILALEEFAAEQEDVFLKGCLHFTLEGVSPEELEEYASIWMLADNAEGNRLLKMAVIADGIVQIMKNQPPKTIFHRLGAWFGSDFAKKFESAMQEIELQEKISHRESRLQSKKSTFPPFDEISEYTPEKILCIAKQRDRSVLAIALKGASGQVYRAIMNSISQTEQDSLEEEIEYLGCLRSCDVEGAQKDILRLAQY